MSIVIEMLNDKGEVYEECEAHACIGDSGCEQPAVCEDHGDTGSPENPVYVWTAADGMGFFACARALASDDYARIKG
jgi:hypothetical protein